MKRLVAYCAIAALTLCVNAQTKSDGRVFRAVVESCVSGNHEPEDCQRLRDGANMYQLPELSALADKLEHRELDKANLAVRTTMIGLCRYAENLFGTGSLEVISGQRAFMQALADTEKEQALMIARSNAKQAELLYRSNPKSADLQVLCQVTRMERVLMESQYDLENPDHWREVFEVEKAMESLVKGGVQPSSEWIDLCLYLSMWKENRPGINIGDYVDYLFRLQFPEGVLMEGLVQDAYVNNSEGWARKAYNDAKKLWGEQDVRTMRCKLRLLTTQLSLPTTDYEQQRDKLKKIQSWLENYLPRGDLLPIEVELLLWDYDVYYGQNVYELARYNMLLLKVGQYYDNRNVAYLSVLHRIMNQQLQTDVSKAAGLLQEEERLLESLFPEHSDLYWAYQIGSAYTRYALSATTPEAYQTFLTTLHDHYLANHTTSWSSLYIGMNLCEIYRQMQRSDDVLSIYSVVLADMEKMVDQASPLWTFVQASYVGYLAETSNPDNLRQASKLANEVIHKLTVLDCSVAALSHQKANIAFGLGQDEEGLKLLRQGIKVCTKEEDGMYRCVMQMELGNRLYYQQGQYVLTPEIHALFSEAIPFFMKYREHADGFYQNCYQYIADYYTNCGQYDKAEDAYLTGMQHLEAKSYQSYYIYENLVTGLFSLYAYQLNNLDKADELIELCIKNAESNYSFNAHLVTANLIFYRYQLLASKNVDISLQMAALAEYTNQIQLARKMNEGDEETLKAMALKMVYSFGQYLPEYASAVKEMEKAIQSPNERTKSMALQTKQMFDTFGQILGSMADIAREDVSEQIGRGGQADNSRLAGAYQYLGNHYLYVCNDTIEAEKYYIQLGQTQTGKSWGLNALASLKESQEKYGEAVKLLEQIVSTSTYETFTSLQNKASDASRIGTCYYRLGQYDKALIQARRFADYRQQLAQLNFDLMTQAEREAFVSQGGTGGTALYTLLPVFKQELAAEAMNAILSEKGLLLRSSERIKKALSLLNDGALMARQDSLQRLQAYYKTLNMVDYIGSDANNNEMVKCRQRMERLERNINREAAKYIEGMNTPDWQAVQAVLKQDEAAIEYVISDSTSLGALVVLAQGHPLYVALTPTNELWNGLEKMKDLDMQQKAEGLYRDDQLKLYAKLWQPIESRLQGINKVFYSPTGFLNDLAFAAFKCVDGTYLFEHYELHQMLSTGDLVALRSHPTLQPVHTSALYGSVFYSPEHKKLALQEHVQEGHRGAVSDAFEYLPFTRSEIEKIENILHNRKVTTKTQLGFAPTEESIHAMNENSPDILHLSTHGFFIKGDKNIMGNKFLARFPATQFSSMQRCGLAFADANRTWEGDTDKLEEADGILTANEVAMLDLSNTHLVVLSACQTAVGEYSLEGVYGMHRGFKQAGVKSILATLWNVNDKSTARLMELFYQNWLSGTPMQQSLNEAVRELRREYPSPFYWAPFVLMDAEN